MVLLKLGYAPKSKWNWELLPKEYGEKNFNGKLVVEIHARLWEKVKNIMKIRSKGFDTIFLIDGDRRTGKSTVAKSVGYLLDPKITIENYVAGLEEAPTKIEKSEDESVLIFDEGSLIANSKDTMKKKNVQLSKIIDVCGVKKLTLIFCMPSFFNLTRNIAIDFSRFLIHIYVDLNLNRGRFAYFSKKKKKILYQIGKKNFGSYAKPQSDWTGRFVDFHLPFEEEYLKLKKKSLMEALNPEESKKEKPPTESELKTKFMMNFKENCPETTNIFISKGFGISTREFTRRQRVWRANKRGCIAGR